MNSPKLCLRFPFLLLDFLLFLHGFEGFLFGLPLLGVPLLPLTPEVDVFLLNFGLVQPIDDGVLTLLNSHLLHRLLTMKTDLGPK